MKVLTKAQRGFTLLLPAMLLTLVPSLWAGTLDMDKLKDMTARSIGPGGMSGRVTAIDVVHNQPNIIYVGTASGGLWRSKGGGTTWEPIFDDQPVASIGAVAVDQSNPDVIWVATGEGNPRNSQNYGNGVYKSIDGGKTWKHLGLEKSRNIHRLIIDPTDPNVVYLGVQGPAWGGVGEERGVYKTTDGGETWERMLYVDEKTGIADLVMDPTNPNKLIAAMWEFRRDPWFFKSGGPGSGLHVTFDGGKTWEKRTEKDGLPAGELGRMGLAIAPSMPNRIYALVEAKRNGFYRSDDGGFKWQKVSEENIGNRPFYYADIFVDPENENRIYNAYSVVSKSEDAGRTFQEFIEYSRVHPDHHAWWIHPQDPDFMINGNDGGLAITHDKGQTWRFAENLPVGQFYHINVDDEIPYNVMGGMQDNGSWRGPAYVWRAGGIRNSYWREVGFGDGFDVIPDKSDPEILYTMSQTGYVRRSNYNTGSQRLIRPLHPESIALRFNWNAAMAHDPHDDTTIYFGSQFLHKSTDRGDTWTIISPDLTTNDPEKQKQMDSGGLTFDVTGAENFTSIVAIAPSPLNRKVIWVGTDDGNLQLTQDGGETWTNLSQNVKGVPEGTWIPQIRASQYNEAEALVVFDNHRRNDWTPYAYHTKDFGKTWKRLVDEKKVDGFALTIIQDIVDPKLMFLGTEFGLFVSIDAGDNWTKWTNGFPTVPTMDLAIQAREHDLAIGTFGRSIYILDDIRPLRALAAKGHALLDEKLAAFDAPDGYLAYWMQADGTRFMADGMYSGENRRDGVSLSFVHNPDEQPKADEDKAEKSEKKDKDRKKKKDAKKEKDQDADKAAAEKTGEDDGAKEEKEPEDKRVKVEIIDALGEVIRTLYVASPKPGLNRIRWSMDRKGVRFPGQAKPTDPKAPEPSGRSVKPGTYTVKFSRGAHEATTQVVVHSDPRTPFSEAVYEAREKLRLEIEAMVEVATQAADRLREVRETVNTIEAQLKEREDDKAKDLKKSNKDLQKQITGLLEHINQKDGVQGYRGDPTIVSSRIFNALYYLGSTQHEPPNDTDRIAVENARKRLDEALTEVNAFFDKDWPAWKKAVDEASIELVKTYDTIEMK